MAPIIGVLMLIASLAAAGPDVMPAAPATATCASSVGPGIAPPSRVASGIPGFHASWYGQSGYMSLCPGERATATVAYFNSGSRGWVSGRLGEVAYLGTWDSEPGQDQPSILGGDGARGSPATGWPRFNRVAVQPAAYVGPGQIAWFQFSLQAPSLPGTYRLGIRPVVEGSTWLEDYGVFWVVTVLNADGTPPALIPVPPQAVTTTVIASYYGPGFYGNRTACGQTMSTTLQGVAHRTLPCGTLVHLKYGANEVTVPVVDRGPQILTREFDLTYATKIALGCPDMCTLSWIH